MLGQGEGRRSISCCRDHSHGKSVIRNQVCASLSCSKVIELDDGHVGESRQAGRLNSTMPSQNHLVAVDDYGIYESEFADVGRQLSDLSARMRPRIFGIRPQHPDWQLLNTQRRDVRAAQSYAAGDHRHLRNQIDLSDAGFCGGLPRH